ncbi:MAG: DUF1700 domain-containing protein [Oscillospiraceae bacterium]|nr:DUF1700 domain-containing protein [Oscillospiraceae bacterium]
MNKLEYLNQLETILKKHLSKAEVDDIIRDYAEFFEEGRRQGKNDAEISAKLGSPELIAEQIMEENGLNSTASASKTEFKIPEIKFEWHRKEKKQAKEEESSAEDADFEPVNKEKHFKVDSKERSGCLGSALIFLLKASVLCLAIPCLLLCFGAVVAALFCAFAALVALFVTVIVGFFAAALVSHFLTWQVTAFAICACIALLALICCFGALLLMLLTYCGRLFMQILRSLLNWPKNLVPVASALSVNPPEYKTESPNQKESDEEEEVEFYE